MAHRLHHHDLSRSQAFNALMNGGARRNGMSIDWDIAGKCERPVSQTSHIRKEGDGLKRGGRSGYNSSSESWNVEYQLRCRRCGPCLRLRRADWAMRARSEIAASVRTWFGTLTLSPQSHFKMLMRVSDRLRKGGTIFETLSEAEQFAERHREISVEITKYLKRVRFNSGATLRMLLVVERHESGLPHYHMLVHETEVSKPVTYRQLASAWPYGHVMFNLVDTHDERTCWYVTKYLAKSSEARVRASLGYGDPPIADWVPAQASSASVDVRGGGTSPLPVKINAPRTAKLLPVSD